MIFVISCFVETFRVVLSLVTLLIISIRYNNILLIWHIKMEKLCNFIWKAFLNHVVKTLNQFKKHFKMFFVFSVISHNSWHTFTLYAKKKWNSSYFLHFVIQSCKNFRTPGLVLCELVARAPPSAQKCHKWPHCATSMIVKKGGSILMPVKYLWCSFLAIILLNTLMEFPRICLTFKSDVIPNYSSSLPDQMENDCLQLWLGER